MSSDKHGAGQEGEELAPDEIRKKIQLLDFTEEQRQFLDALSEQDGKDKKDD